MDTYPEQGTAPASRTYWYFYQATDSSMGTVGFTLHRDGGLTIEWVTDGVVTMAQRYARHHPLTTLLRHRVHVDRLHQGSYEIQSPYLNGGLTYTLSPVPNQRRVDSYVDSTL